MQNRWRFFYAIVATLWSLSAAGQDNTKGDRSPIQGMEGTHKSALIEGREKAAPSTFP